MNPANGSGGGTGGSGGSNLTGGNVVGIELSNATLARAAEADFSHSAYFYLSPSVAGLNTVGASGHDFMAPVPEPAAAALLVAGLLALALRHKARS